MGSLQAQNASPSSKQAPGRHQPIRQSGRSSSSGVVRNRELRRRHNPDLAVVADSAYGSHTEWASRPKPANEFRPIEDIRFTRAIASFRAPVERTAAPLKQWRILSTGYRDA
ncbi:transposase family protein [Promicromonospora soli]